MTILILSEINLKFKIIMKPRTCNEEKTLNWEPQGFDPSTYGETAERTAVHEATG